MIGVVLFSLLVLCFGEDTQCTEGSCTEDKLKMEYRYFGKTGLLVSALGYGDMYNLKTEEEAFELVKYMVGNGVNFFDTAEVYGWGKSESLFGYAIEKGIELGYWRREQLVISTKVFFGDRIYQPGDNIGLSRKHIIEGVNASLKRLRLDYADVIFCHRPDNQTPLEETVRAMNWLIDQGKTFYWGTSEWPAEHIREAHSIAKSLGLIGPVVEQTEYSLFDRERIEQEYLSLYDNPGLALTIWGALHHGILSGKYKNGIPADSRLSQNYYMGLIDNENSPLYKGGFNYTVEMAKKVGEIADSIGITSAQLAIGWVLKNQRVSTLLLGGGLKYMKENLESLKIISKITPEVLEKLDNLFQNKPKPSMDWKELFKPK